MGDKDQESGANKLNRVRSGAVQQTDYNTHMITVGIIGIYDLDKEVKVFSESDTTKEGGTYSLRGGTL